jgi:hypothetical protein
MMPDNERHLQLKRYEEQRAARGVFSISEGGAEYDLRDVPSSVLAQALAARKDYASDELPDWVTDEGIAQSPRAWALLAEITAEKRIARERVIDKATHEANERILRELDGRRG